LSMMVVGSDRSILVIIGTREALKLLDSMSGRTAFWFGNMWFKVGLVFVYLTQDVTCCD
jgi:hypothetical protein